MLPPPRCWQRGLALLAVRCGASARCDRAKSRSSDPALDDVVADPLQGVARTRLGEAAQLRGGFVREFLGASLCLGDRVRPADQADHGVEVLLVEVILVQNTAEAGTDLGVGESEHEG